jgi:hypothetical protein
VKKALLAAGVAVAAAAGVIAAVIVSSGSGGETARPRSSTPPPASTTSVSTSSTLQPQEPSTGTTSAGPPASTTTPTAAPTTLAAPTTTAALPPAPSPRSHRRRTFAVGVVDDALAQQDLAAARTQVEISRRAGFDAVVLSATWVRGRKTPLRSTVHALRNVAVATRRKHMRLFLVAWQGLAPNTPRNDDERAQFASFAAELVKQVPGVRGVIVGNEPNLNTFWVPQFGADGRDLAAAAYEDLLARTYDELKDAAPHVTVIGGALSPRGADRPRGIRPTHSPTAFIRDLGAAYRASGRRSPLMDAFAIHPYMLDPGVPPTVAHPKTTQITLADYPKLVTLLDEAFRRTPQRGRTLPILYTEFGVQTAVPPSKRAAYGAGASGTSELGVSFSTQVAYYRQALALAYCQPTVRGLFVFHTFDEAALDGWQSGLYYADRTPKPSLKGFRRAVADLRNGKLTACAR